MPIKIISILLVSSFFGFVASSKDTYPAIKIETRNTVALFGEITPESIAGVKAELKKVSKKLKQKEPIYLVVNSGGGFIDAGDDLIEFTHSIPNVIHTITIESASMAFRIVQTQGERYIVPHGTMMDHFRLIMFAPQFFSIKDAQEMINQAWEEELKHNEQCGKRMGLPLAEYQKLIEKEMRFHDGLSAVRSNAADKVVIAECGKSWKREKRKCPLGI